MFCQSPSEILMEANSGRQHMAGNPWISIVQCPKKIAKKIQIKMNTLNNAEN